MSTQMSSAASPRTIATITATAELTAPEKVKFLHP